MKDAVWLTNDVFTIDEFFTAEECDEFIRLSEDWGYEDATVVTPQGVMRLANVRNNDRVIMDSPQIAARLWKKAKDFVPPDWDDRPVVGLNERLRFYRYDVGQKFDWHVDGYYERDNGERSFWTMMIYLNDDFEGGETSFDDSYSDEPFDEFQVVPRKGMALFFVHEIYHKGEPVTDGRKYVLRTDVMYGAEEAEDREDFDFWN